MNNTNVYSDNQEKENIAPACSQVVPTEKNLEFPPNKDKYNTHNYGVSYDQAKEGEIEFQTGNSRVNEDGTLELQNGTTIAMVNPKAYQVIANYMRQQKEMKEKAKQRGMTKVSNGKSGQEMAD